MKQGCGGFPAPPRAEAVLREREWYSPSPRWFPLGKSGKCQASFTCLNTVRSAVWLMNERLWKRKEQQKHAYCELNSSAHTKLTSAPVYSRPPHAHTPVGKRAGLSHPLGALFFPLGCFAVAGQDKNARNAKSRHAALCPVPVCPPWLPPASLARHKNRIFTRATSDIHSHTSCYQEKTLSQRLEWALINCVATGTSLWGRGESTHS